MLSRLAPAAMPAPERFRQLIAARLGLRFEPRQQHWLGEVLARRAGSSALHRYLDALEHAPVAAELHALAAELTVGETFFFRHPEQFDALRLEVLPALLRRAGARPLSVLSAGCASGEEAYSLAVCLQTMGAPVQARDWQLHAFDLNPVALRKAALARYGEWSLRATSENLRGHWFRACGTEFEPLPPLRQRIRFEQRNIGRPDPEFWQAGRFDIVFCRNVLMYLDAAALQIALANIAEALVPGGFLFLGHAETLRGQTTDFRLRQGEGCFYYQRALPEAGMQRVAPAVEPGPAEFAVPLQQAGRATVFQLLRDERHAQALRLTERLLAEDGADAELLLAHAVLLIEAARLDAGRQACELLLVLGASRPTQAGARFVQALANESAADLAAAEQGYRLAARLDPRFAMPHLRLGLLARRRGEIVTMRRELLHALALLDREDERRLLLFGGGFGRAALLSLCRAELGEAGA